MSSSSTSRIPWRAIWTVLPYVLVATYLAAIAADIALHPTRFQWDFRTYHAAGLAAKQGLNPYYLGQLSEAAGRSIGFPFAYPPATLILLRPLAMLPLETAHYAYLGLKLLALAALFWIWFKILPKAQQSAWLFVFALLAFNGAIYIDLASGNISIFEQLLLWLAFAALLRDRLFAFGGLVLLVSLLKISLFPFLGLALLSNQPSRRRILLGTSALFGVYLMIGYTSQPILFTDFVSVATGLDSRGIRNPASLALIRDLSEWIDERLFAVPDVLPWLVYGTVATVVVAVTIGAYRRSVDKDRLLWLCVFCFAYALAVPRLKDYSYVVLVLPAFFLAYRLPTMATPTAILVVLSLAPSWAVPFGLAPQIKALIWGYYPLLCAAAIWVLALIHLSSRRVVGSRAEVPASVN